jgi:carbamoylphosphate synthase small subunit
MRRRRRHRNHSPQKYNSIQYSIGNEENGHPVSDTNKIMINITKEPSDTHKKKTLKEEILEKNHWEIHGIDTRHS